MRMENSFKWKIIVILVLSLLIVAGLIYLTILRAEKGMLGNGAPKPAPTPAASAEATAEVTEAPEAVVTAEPEPVETKAPVSSSSADTESNDSLTKIVNKSHPIDAGYVPSDLVSVDVRTDLDTLPMLRAEAADSLIRLFNDAIDEKIYFKLNSGYRSYEEQAEWEEYYAGIYGADAIEGMDCHPGMSEHQLGLAVDLGNWNGECDNDVCFSWYPTYTFLIEHGHEYGFIERYPEGSSKITGYDDVVWHWRYVGVEEATKIHDSGLTMEEYYGK